MTRGEDIRALRKSAGLTQAQLGALTGTAKRTVQDWEAGRRNIPPAKWELLREKLKKQRNKAGYLGAWVRIRRKDKRERR